MAELHTHEKAWKRITALLKRRPTRCRVAVAYFGKGASKLLPLGKGSTLVVDLSERAVKAGQTMPSEVLKLVNKGVDAYSVENLHAKVFVLGQRALVGSTNVSNTSAGHLVEAILETGDGRAVSACRQFVMSLGVAGVGREHLKRLQKLWRGPSFGFGGTKARRTKHTTPQHAPLWVLPLEVLTPDEEDEKAVERGNAKAKSRLRSQRLFYLDDFVLYGNWIDPLSRNDIVIQVVDEDRHSRFVYGPARILNIERYRKGRLRRAAVSVEAARKHRRRSLAQVIKRLPPSARSLARANRPRRVGDPLLAHALMSLWQSARTPKRRRAVV